MKLWLTALLIVAPGLAGAQSLLDFRDDLAFERNTIESFAARSHGEKLHRLELDQTLDTDPVLVERIQSLVARLQRAVAIERPSRNNVRWEIHTCRRCNEDASAMAGGKLLLGENFLDALQPTDDELAYLLAHEMAHVLAEHTREFATAARYFVDNGLRRDYADIQDELDESIPVLLRMATLSASQELEADYIGYILGARAGFDPTGMLGLLKKLGRDEGPSILATHPGNSLRIKQAQTILPIGLALAEIAKSSHDQ